MANPKTLALLTVLLWSTGQTLGRLVSQRSAYLMLALGLAFTSLTFAAVMRYVEKESVVRRIRSLPASYFVFAALGYLGYWYAVMQCSRAYDTAAEPVVLNYTFPIFTVIFTEMFFRHGSGRRSPWLEASGVALSFVSLLVLASEGDVLRLDIQNATGVGWGLLAGATYGLYSAFSSTVSRERQLPFLLVSSVWGVVGMAALAVLTPSETLDLSAQDWVLVLAMGAIVEGFGYITWTRANRTAREQRVNIASVTSLIYFLPVVSVVIASLVFRETSVLEPYFVVVLALLTTGSVLCQKGAARAEE